MSFFEIFPTFKEAPYSYFIVPVMLISSIIGFYNKRYFHALLLHPYEVYRGKRMHTLLTSVFVHRNWLHLLFNSFIVFALSYDLYGCIYQEYHVYISIVSTPVLIFLLIVIPNMLQTQIRKDDFVFTSVGSSGLTFGLFGFGFLFFPLHETSSFLIPFIRNSFDYWLSVLVLFALLSFIPKSSVNKQLHIFAFLIGSVLSLLCRPQSINEILSLLQKN